MVYAREHDQKHLLNTARLVRSYKGRYEGTNLLNCLLALLVLPHDKMFGRIPDVPIAQLAGWGIQEDSIRTLAGGHNGNGHRPTLRKVVKSLRQAVGECKVKPRTYGQVTGFEFRTSDGFWALLPADQLKTFTQNLATHLAEQLADEDQLGRMGAMTGVRYVASVRRDPFHRMSCKCARRIKPDNFQVLKTRRTAMRDGHRPCRFCKP